MAPVPTILDEVRPLTLLPVVSKTRGGKRWNEFVARWFRVRATQARACYDRDKLYDKPRKDIWLRPLQEGWKRILNR